MKRDLPIAVFDSGVGGVGVLERCRDLLPLEDFIYYGDSANFPYGGKSTGVVKQAVLEVVEILAEKGIKALVIACNTATSAAISELRRTYDFPILGMEPALKPAVERGGRIAVIATELTLKEEKFRALLAENSQAQIVLFPAPGLADLVEAGHYADKEARLYLSRLFEGLGPIDAFVLGCTHYAFLLPYIREFYPHVAVFEGSDGTARYLRQRLETEDLLGKQGTGKVMVLSSGGPAFSRTFPKFLADISEIFAGESHKLK